MYTLAACVWWGVANLGWVNIPVVEYAVTAALL